MYSSCRIPLQAQCASASIRPTHEELTLPLQKPNSSQQINDVHHLQFIPPTSSAAIYCAIMHAHALAKTAKWLQDARAQNQSAPRRKCRCGHHSISSELFYPKLSLAFLLHLCYFSRDQFLSMVVQLRRHCFRISYDASLSVSHLLCWVVS